MRQSILIVSAVALLCTPVGLEASPPPLVQTRESHPSSCSIPESHIFSARIAGNVLDDELRGSLEFAASVAGAKTIVVLGHTQCGAVKGACDGVQLGHLTETLSHLRPALAAAQDVPGTHDGMNAEFVGRVAEENARLAAKAVLERSAILRELVEQGELSVSAAIYDVSSGRVSFLD